MRPRWSRTVPSVALALVLACGGTTGPVPPDPGPPMEPPGAPEPPPTGGPSIPPQPAPRERCGPYPAWDTSPYVLPYPVGTGYVVDQGNCSGYGHSGFWKHSYDFLMPIGTVVTAARAGRVGWANDGCPDYHTECTNLITVIHDDGTVALYSHLTPGGVEVVPGQRVEAGERIGRSGVTGNTGGLPHLHFSIHPCNQLPGLPGATYCPSLPVTFRNTLPNTNGLQPGRLYPALGP